MSKQIRYFCTIPVMLAVSVEHTGPDGMTDRELFDAICEGMSYRVELTRLEGDTAYPDVQSADEVFRAQEGNFSLLTCDRFSVDEREED